MPGCGVERCKYGLCVACATCKGHGEVVHPDGDGERECTHKVRKRRDKREELGVAEPEAQSRLSERPTKKIKYTEETESSDDEEQDEILEGIVLLRHFAAWLEVCSAVAAHVIE